MPSSDDALEAYLRRAQNAAQARDAAAALRPENLESIAAELGLTQADLDAARAARAEHQTRGEAFLRHGRHQDAVAELAAAVALNPGDANLLLRLAEGHLGLYQQKGDAEELQAAQALVRQAIALEPNLQAAYDLLNRLDPPSAPSFPIQARQSALWAGGAAVLLALGAAIYAFSATSPAPAPQQVPSVPLAPQKHQDPETLTPWAGGAAEAGQSTLPGRLMGQPEGLKLDLRASKLLVTAEGKAYLTLSTLLLWEGQGELEGLELSLLVRNAQGLLRQREKLDLLPSHQPPRWPGDRIYFNTTLATAPDAAQLELVVQKAPIRPLLGRPALGKSFPLAWAVQAPTGVQLAAALRRNGMPAPGEGVRYAKPVFSILNRGAVPLRRLVLELSLLNAQGEVLIKRRHHALPGEGLSLDPGASVVAGFILEAPPSLHHMQLAVVEAE